MIEREAMKLALDFLESGMPSDLYGMDKEQHQTAIIALRQALDHVPDTMKMTEPDMGIDRGAWDDVPDATKWVDELRGGDETEEQEPVAWVKMEEGEIVFDIDFSFGEELLRQLETEHNVPLYLAPHKREWVGLTDEERYLNDCRSEEDIEYARAIEAKLREKNGF